MKDFIMDNKKVEYVNRQGHMCQNYMKCGDRAIFCLSHVTKLLRQRNQEVI